MGGAWQVCALALAACVGLGVARAPAPSQPQPEDAVEPADARESVVRLKDGRRYTGTLVKRDDASVTLRIAGIDTTWWMDEVASVETQPSLREQYRAYRDAIDPGDSDRLLALARWLDARDMFDEALDELDHVLEADPRHASAVELRRVVAARRELASKTRRAGEPSPEHAGVVGTDFQRSFPVLDADQINIIRVFEVDLADPPRMMVERAAIDRLIAGYASSPLIPTSPEAREALYRLPPAGVLDLMFQLRARELYGQVRVLENPRSIKLFRDAVHDGWLINSCANTACHGGAHAGSLTLRQRRSSSDETAYTNFLILERHRLHGVPLINHDAPGQSPLLHLAMRRDASLHPHPAAFSEGGRSDRWKPIFQSTDDRKFREAVNWIQSMYTPRPDYPIEYTPPNPAGSPALPTDRPPNEPR